jgi:hypothetical protein
MMKGYAELAGAAFFSGRRAGQFPLNPGTTARKSRAFF